jgi:subtilisin-like proprotein convertase family protein
MPLSLFFNPCSERVKTAMAGLLLAGLLSGCGGGGGGGGRDAQAFGPAPFVPPTTPGPDPLLERQWHLFNSGQSGGVPGMDIGLQGVTETGRGVLIAFVDGAVQLSHPDLVANVFNLNGMLPAADSSPPPAPPSATYNPSAGQWDDAHGTAVVGIAVASANNGLGGRGVAPESKFVAYNGVVTGLVASALRSAIDLGADIVNNSWGALDSQTGQGGSYQSSDPAWREAMTVAIGQGRRGRGTVVVFAAGNGGSSEDSNRDAYVNHPGVLAVGAVDHRGRPSSYAEPGANLLISAPSMSLLRRTDAGADIWTTDIAGPRGLAAGSLPENADYAAFAGGTSAAAPMVSGVVALMLQANPALTWRDVRWLLARTARSADLSPEQAETSPMNAHGFHPRVGFGRVHAADAVTAARGFAGLPLERQCDSGVLPVEQAIGDAPAPALVVSTQLEGCDLKTVESVQVSLVVDHAYGADLDVVLISPSGTRSQLARPHACASDRPEPCGDLSKGWTFHSVRHMGEAASGAGPGPSQGPLNKRWHLQLKDGQSADVGFWRSWRLLITGH